MSFELTFVLGLTVVACALMASNRVRLDVVALIVVLALMLSGILTPAEALAGFGNTVVILVAGLLIIGEMLDRTGVAKTIGDRILARGGSNETRLLVMLMVAAAILSAVMSSTAVVAIFIPITLRIAAEAGLNASRILMPVAFAAMIGGMLTLIATPATLVVHEQLQDSGYAGLGFFTISPIGLAILGAGVVYVLVIGRRMVGGSTRPAERDNHARALRDLWQEFSRAPEFARIGPNSALAGKTIAESEIHRRHGTWILGIHRQSRGNESIIVLPQGELELRSGDTLLLVADEPVEPTEAMAKLELSPYRASKRERQTWLWEIGAASMLISPESRLIGKTIREARFRTDTGLHVLGLRRGQQPVEDFRNTRLTAADSLLVAGTWAQITARLERNHDFVLLEMPAERAQVVPAWRQMTVSLAILGAMIGLSVFEIVPLVAAVILAVLAAVYSRCLTMEEAYRSIHWSSVVLLAGMLSLAEALDKTGGMQLLVDTLTEGAGDAGPLAMLTAIFFLTAIPSLFLSNTAAAILVAPIAIFTAEALGFSPYPFAITVAVAASSAFATPIASPVVTLVVEPGRYRFVDFLKAGLPLMIIAWLITLFLVPVLFPLTD
jgi:di/tricarboxylate transporter